MVVSVGLSQGMCQVVSWLCQLPRPAAVSGPDNVSSMDVRMHHVYICRSSSSSQGAASQHQRHVKHEMVQSDRTSLTTADSHILTPSMHWGHELLPKAYAATASSGLQSQATMGLPASCLTRKALPKLAARAELHAPGSSLAACLVDVDLGGLGTRDDLRRGGAGRCRVHSRHQEQS